MKHWDPLCFCLRSLLSTVYYLGLSGGHGNRFRVATWIAINQSALLRYMLDLGARVH